MDAEHPVSNTFAAPAQPLCIVGSHLGDEVNAQIALSISNASLSSEKPRLLVLLWKTNHTHDLVHASGSMCVSLLSRDQYPLIEPLGLRPSEQRNDRHGKLDGLPTRLTEAGDPYFEGSLAYADCRVVATLDLGDATVFAVAVRSEHVLSEGEPVTWEEAMDELDPDFLSRYEAQYHNDEQFALERMKWL